MAGPHSIRLVPSARYGINQTMATHPTDHVLRLPRPLLSTRSLRPTIDAWPALASGLLGWLADYPNPVPVLAWIAPVPVLVAALRRGPRAAWRLGILWGLGATAATWQAVDPVALPLGPTAGLVA